VPAFEGGTLNAATRAKPVRAEKTTRDTLFITNLLLDLTGEQRKSNHEAILGNQRKNEISSFNWWRYEFFSGTGVIIRASIAHGKLSANAPNLLGKTTLWQANPFLCKIFL
jgi:hypothetical protein